ncbi:hypothetical protein AAVH_06422 [Aphelenchoides avenae]|nr:hypothetical protein AAVH_06422 [Aphelenchus avenae]
MNATSLESSACTDDQAFHALHRYLDLSFHWTGVVLNLVLLYLVNNHSGSNVGPYKNVFRLTCASDLTVSFFAMIGQKTILVDSGNLVFFSNSILSRRWPLLDFFAVFGVTGNHFMNTVFLPMQYVYRYLSLCR